MRRHPKDALVLQELETERDVKRYWVLHDLEDDVVRSGARYYGVTEVPAHADYTEEIQRLAVDAEGGSCISFGCGFNGLAGQFGDSFRHDVVAHVAGVQQGTHLHDCDLRVVVVGLDVEHVLQGRLIFVQTVPRMVCVWTR